MLILYHFLHISIFSIAILTARPASSSARAPRLRSSAPPARCPCRQRGFCALIRISCDDLGPFHESPHGLVQVHSNYTKNHIWRAEFCVPASAEGVFRRHAFCFSRKAVAEPSRWSRVR